MDTPVVSDPEKRPRLKRAYSDEFIAHALVVLKTNDFNQAKTARELSIPRLTLREWARNDRRVTDEVRAAIQTEEPRMIDKLAVVANLYVDHAMRPEVVGEASGVDAMKTAGIAIDKRQLLTGQPTSIHEERTIDSRQVLVLLQESLGT